MSNKQAEPFKNLIDDVTGQIELLSKEGRLNLPKSYSAQNALKTAYIIIKQTVDKDKRPATDVCTKESIALALLKMVLLGLDPMKKQVAFIVRGNQLSCEPQYQGNLVLAKRFSNLSHHYSNVIYKNDMFEYSIDPETGRKVLIKHEQKLDNVDLNAIVGAYCILVFGDGKPNHLEIMSMVQVRTSWNQGMGSSPAHKNFPDQMAAKTVTNRALKLYIQGSDDEGLDMIEQAEETAQASVPEITGNSTEISIEDEQPKQVQKRMEPLKSIPEPPARKQKQPVQADTQEDSPFAYETRNPAQVTLDGPGF